MKLHIPIFPILTPIRFFNYVTPYFSILPTYLKSGTCALYLKQEVFYVACAKFNKIRDDLPGAKTRIIYIKEITVTMVFHGITTPLQ